MGPGLDNVSYRILDPYTKEPGLNHLLTLHAKMVGELTNLTEKRNKELSAKQNEINAVLLTLQIYCEQQGIEMPELGD